MCVCVGIVCVCVCGRSVASREPHVPPALLYVCVSVRVPPVILASVPSCSACLLACSLLLLLSTAVYPKSAVASSATQFLLYSLPRAGSHPGNSGSRDRDVLAVPACVS